MIDVKEMMKAADEMREALPVMCRLMRVYYSELIAAGFTRTEAIKLIAAHGPVPPIGSR